MTMPSRLRAFGSSAPRTDAAARPVTPARKPRRSMLSTSAMIASRCGMGPILRRSAPANYSAIQNRRSPDSANGVRVEGRISTDNRHALDDGLGNEQSVKRVTVVERQCDQFGRVARLDGQDCEAVIDDGLLDESGERDVQGVFPDAELDRHLPVAGRADRHLVCRIFDVLLGSGTQLRVIEVVPEERVRVEQHVHGMYSVKSLKCSSSSAWMTNLPLPRPAIGIPFGI